MILENRPSDRRNHRAADYGIVGDWNEYLPPIIEAIKPVLAEHGLA